MSIASLNVNITGADGGTPVAAYSGSVDTINGWALACQRHVKTKAKAEREQLAGENFENRFTTESYRLRKSKAQ